MGVYFKTFEVNGMNLVIEMTYRLQGGVLEVQTRITNMSAEPMPVAVGFILITKVDRLDARKNGRFWPVHLQHWKLGATKIPTGRDAEPIENLFTNPLSAALKDYDLDHVFRSGARPRTRPHGLKRKALRSWK
jgi:aldose 1-epimerase